MLPAVVIAVALVLPPIEPEPTVADLARFPDAKGVDYWLKAGEQYEEYCLGMASGEPWAHRRGWWAAAAEEARQRQDAWRYLHWAQLYGGESPDACVIYLRYLRGEIGPARYWSGQMPPPVPFWRFQLR